MPSGRLEPKDAAPRARHGEAVDPFALPEGLDLDLIFYLIYAYAPLTFSLELRDEAGALVRTIENIATFNSADNKVLTLDVRRILGAPASRTCRA